MFYQPSASRPVLEEWVREVCAWLTFDSSDRVYLDSITASEVTDLAYLEGSELSEAIAAHALYPPEVERNEAQKGSGASSSMEITFPIKIHEEHWGYEITLRAGRPSMLAIGIAGRYPIRTSRTGPPAEILSPNVGGTTYQFLEPDGQRLGVLAGPMESVERVVRKEVEQQTGMQTVLFELHQASRTYAYVDEHGALHQQVGEGGSLVALEDLEELPRRFNSFYLRELRTACNIELVASWEQRQAEEGRMTVSLKLRSNRGEEDELSSREAALGALILPHLRVALHGATAQFPAQQYAAAKRRFLNLTEEERLEEASNRLYQVRQSGCIATRDPVDSSLIGMTTFGIFDTPREIPVAGPSVEEVTQNPEGLLAALLNRSEAVDGFVRGNWDTIRSILLAASQAFDLERFHKFQWDAITTGLELEATKRERTATLIRAPTGSGKTIVFMVNAAVSSLCGQERSTSVLLFPTRLLNEDMFRRLTAFVYRMRESMPEQHVTGGILMGTSDELYQLLLEPKEGEVMHHYGRCPACRAEHNHLVALPDAQGRLVPTCQNCGHTITYMYNPYEVLAYLPDIIIATPDKVFVEATTQDFEIGRYGLFGLPVRQCPGCGRFVANAWFALKPDKDHCNEIPRHPRLPNTHCKEQFGPDTQSKPIRYMGFDEVHSLYGQTVTYLSVFLTTLEAMQRVLTGRNSLSIRYETATATIANERNLLEAITRRRADRGEIIVIPGEGEVGNYFTIDESRVRHRVLLAMPARLTSRQVTIRAMLNSYRHLRGPDADLKERLRHVTNGVENSWDFLLGYVFKKQDGFDLRRGLKDYYQNAFPAHLNIQFLSGSSPKNQLVRYIDEARNGEVDILVANLVVSLGIDVQDLNHMVMFGVPRSFTEYAQTAGRLGRGDVSGHVNIILLPNWPRDTYLYRHFHAVFSDVAGYYDVLPVRSTNLHCSEEIFGNVARAVLSALCIIRPVWTQRDRVLEAVTGREAQIRGGISRLLCDDPRLQADTDRIVLRKYRLLMDDIRANSSFLGQVMSEKKWFLYGLRERTENLIRVVCSDDDLIDRLTKEDGIAWHEGAVELQELEEAPA